MCVHLSVRALEDTQVTYKIIQRWHSVVQRWTQELCCSMVSGSTIPVFGTVNACILHQISNLNSLPQYTTHHTPIDHDFPPLLVYVCLFFMRKRPRSRTRYFIRCVYVHKCFVCCVLVFSVSWSSTKPRLVTFKYDVTLLTRPRISNTPFTMHM